MGAIGPRKRRCGRSASQETLAPESKGVVVFDGSARALENLRRASSVAEEGRAELEIVVVADVSRWSFAFALAGGQDTVTLEDEMLDELQRKVSEEIVDLARRIDVRVRVVHGDYSRAQRSLRG